MPAILFLALPAAGTAEVPAQRPPRQLKRDDLVTHDARLYFVRGFDPIGVVPTRVYLEDAETREPLTIALAELTDRRLRALAPQPCIAARPD